MKTTTALLVLVLMAAGCAKAPENKVASVSGDGKTSSSAQPEAKGGDKEVDQQKMLDFAKCMREHGVEMPDPETKDGGVAIRIDGNVDQEAMKKADEACKKHLPNGGEMRKPSPEDLDKMRQQAKCMRDKGYDFPDPDPEGGVGMSLPMDDAEKTQKDMKDCGFEGAVRIGG